MPNNTSPWVFLTNTETQVTRYWWSKDSEMFLETKAMITSAFWRSLTTFNSCEMMAKKSAKKCATTGYAQSFCYADYKPVTLSFVIVMHGFLFLRSPCNLAILDMQQFCWKLNWRFDRKCVTKMTSTGIPIERLTFLVCPTTCKATWTNPFWAAPLCSRLLSNFNVRIKARIFQLSRYAKRIAKATECYLITSSAVCHSDPVLPSVASRVLPTK